MYSKFQLAKKYIKYYLTAYNGKGHGVHSPFVFDFIKFVKNDKSGYPFYKEIEARRKELLNENIIIEVEDFGAGSSIVKNRNRKISEIASSSLKPKKFSRLLHRIVQYYSCAHVLELGTSLGTTTAYLASAKNNPLVITMEGSENIAGIAKHNFSALSIKNIQLVVGDFENTLGAVLAKNPVTDFAFLDGNHRKVPTLKYFKQLLETCSENSIIVFDDIHWSKEMEDAWAEIKQHKEVTLTVDLFFIGIVFFRKEFKVKQHFTLRF